LIKQWHVQNLEMDEIHVTLKKINIDEIGPIGGNIMQ